MTRWAVERPGCWPGARSSLLDRRAWAVVASAPTRLTRQREERHEQWTDVATGLKRLGRKAGPAQPRVDHALRLGRDRWDLRAQNQGRRQIVPRVEGPGRGRHRGAGHLGRDA